jgi:Skp family chaperone for outer membrane proteins
MRFKQALWVIVLGAVVSLVGVASSQAAIKAGVIDIAKVTNSYDRTTEANKSLDAEQKRLKDEADKKVDELKALKGKLDLQTKGTPEFKATSEELMTKSVAYQGWLAIEQAKIEIRHRDILLDMYHEVEAVVAALAAEKGLDIVYTQAFLKPPQFDLNQSQGLEDLKNRILNQRILFPANVVDLTEEVIKRLNAAWAAKKGPAAPAAPVAPPAKQP